MRESTFETFVDKYSKPLIEMKTRVLRGEAIEEVIIQNISSFKGSGVGVLGISDYLHQYISAHGIVNQK